MSIRTFVVDDTVTWRRLAAAAASEFDDVEVVGAASSGELALKKMAVQPPDLVLCDVHMPGLDGVETLRRIRRRFPRTLVVMMSGISTRNTDSTIEALEGGAVDFIRKPDGKTAKDNRKRLHDDIAAVLRTVRVRLNVRGVARGSSTLPSGAPAEPAAHHVWPAGVPKTFSVVTIGVSTGGPEALTKLIPALPGSLPVPVLVVQHMPAGFTASLAESLNRKSVLRVVEAREGDEIRAGTVYIAPGGRHMTVRQGEGKPVVGCSDGPPVNSCRPAVDVLFRSVADVYGKRGILAAILTGMGADGAAGVRTMKRQGCLCITQSRESCVVYGMPQAIDAAGLSDINLPIEDIAPTIVEKLT